MKTSITTLGLGLFLTLGACSLAGCAQSTDDSASSSDQASSALTAALSSQVLHAVPNATAADYHLTNKTFRLFGTQQKADGGGFATIADKADWSTKNIATGDWLARNLQVAALHDDSIDLRTATGTITVARGKDFVVSALYHRFDTAAVYEGKDAWHVDGKTMADIQKQFGAGAAAEDHSAIAPAAVGLGAAPQSAVIVTSSDERGVLAHVGIVESSVLIGMNGVTLHAADMNKVATALTKSGTTVSLMISEHGAQHPITIEVD